MKSLGFIEVSGVVAAVDALDVMCKSADVEFVTWERKLGGRMVTVIVTGSVSDVTEAIECAKRNAVLPIMASNVIANPHEETIRMVKLSASRIERQLAERAAKDATPVSASAEESAPAAEAAPKTPKTTRTRKTAAKPVADEIKQEKEGE